MYFIERERERLWRDYDFDPLQGNTKVEREREREIIVEGLLNLTRYNTKIEQREREREREIVPSQIQSVSPPTGILHCQWWAVAYVWNTAVCTAVCRLRNGRSLLKTWQLVGWFQFRLGWGTGLVHCMGKGTKVGVGIAVEGNPKCFIFIFLLCLLCVYVHACFNARCVCVSVSVCVCVCVQARACVRACVRACTQSRDL